MSDYPPQLIEKLAEHLFLTGVATGIAIVLGLPLAIYIHGRPIWSKLTLSTIGVFQTIPSLALLAFLIPFLGIGALPAIVALTVYAFLPIVRNVVTGLEGVEPDLVDSADSLGLTRWQRLWLVELPLASPVIIAGIRTATVIGVGVATLAAFIGAGGLGDFITRGLAVNSNELILQGAIPAALLALLLDFMIVRCEFLCSAEKRRNKSRLRRELFALFACLIALGVPLALYGMTTLKRTESGIVVVGSKNFTEQFILGELIAQTIEKETELQVERRLNLGSATVCHRAMRHGELDIYPEYTGTGFRVILERKDDPNPEEIFRIVQSEYRKLFGIEWFPGFGFNDTYAVVVRRAFAEEHGLRTVSDLKRLASNSPLAMSSEFYQRPDGYVNFTRHYGFEFADVREMDLGLLYRATKEGTVDILIGNSTDGRIPAFDLQVLEDDREYFLSYHAAPLVRASTLERFPELRPALETLAGTVDEHTMQRLNAAVDQEGRSPAEVAKEFLLSLR